MMQRTKSSKTGHGKRRAWRAPTVTILPIGAQTKTIPTRAPDARAQPPVPAAPEGKLGFSFEMSLPLSARTGG
jgi:hypothetical protein